MRQHVGGPAPGGPYSPGMVAEGRLLFVSGQGPLRDGKLVSGGIGQQTRVTLENLGTVLQRAGAGYADVVRCGVFITRDDDFAEVNCVYREFFPEPLPARTTVVTQLLGGIGIEIDCVAVLTG